MFVLEKDVREHSPGFYTLEAGLLFVEKYGWKGNTGFPLERILYSCKPAHADVLLRQWLPSKTKLLRRYTAAILGQIRLFRAIPSLKDRLDDPDESHEVVENAATSLGNIGGSETIRTLWAACDRFKGKQVAASLLVACRRGLRYCLDQEEDPQTFRVIALDLLSEPHCQHWLCYRAIGIQKNDSLVDELRKAIHGTESIDRGAALLALARLGVRDALQLARTAYDQAADSWESIFAALAILTVDPKLLTPNLLSKLRADLATESVNYMRHAREDIISTLRSLNHPEATLMADSWAYAYRPTIDY
jgi:HEAT repeat protein